MRFPLPLLALSLFASACSSDRSPTNTPPETTMRSSGVGGEDPEVEGGEGAALEMAAADRSLSDASGGRVARALSPDDPAVQALKAAFATPVKMVIADGPIGDGVLARGQLPAAPGQAAFLVFAPNTHSARVEQAARHALATAMADRAGRGQLSLTLYSDWSFAFGDNPKAPRRSMTVARTLPSPQEASAFAAWVSRGLSSERVTVAGYSGRVLKGS